MIVGFSAAPKTTYSIRAAGTTKASKTVQGSCTVKSGKASCKSKPPSKAKWIVAPKRPPARGRAV